MTTAVADEILSFRHVFTSNMFWNGIHCDQHHTHTHQFTQHQSDPVPPRCLIKPWTVRDIDCILKHL